MGRLQPEDLELERVALHRAVRRLTLNGWAQRVTPHGATLHWHSGHLETIVVRAKVVGGEPRMTRDGLGGAWQFGDGWLVLDCEISDVEHPRGWAALHELVAALSQII